jgi:hypothetical protein
MGSGGYPSGRRINLYNGCVTRYRKHASLHADFHQRNDAMPTHGTEAFIMDEQHTNIAVGCNRRC